MTLRKKSVELDVLAMARERMSYAFDRFDRIAVGFSGGKDSTCTLHVALDEARRRGRLPLDAFFWDEEAIFPTTIDYVERVRQWPDVRLHWLCVPVRHRNGCSRKQPYWYPWAPEDEAKWCRPMPEWAIRSLSGHDRQPIPESNFALFPKTAGTVGYMLGLRATESMRRFRIVTQRTYENWLSVDPTASNVYLCKPIYDWSVDDVWTAIGKEGWDYDRTYDAMKAAGVSKAQQRVCPPFGEEPMRRLWQYAECWPDLWEKMAGRVKGARTSAMYSSSPLYAYGELPPKPSELTWEDYIKSILAKWPETERKKIAHEIRRNIDLHAKKTDGAPLVPDDHLVSGIGWKFLSMLALRGDLKRRKSPKLIDPNYEANLTAELERY